MISLHSWTQEQVTSTGQPMLASSQVCWSKVLLWDNTLATGDYCISEKMHHLCAISMYNNNNNNDRLTAFDPGQPG